MITHKRLLSQDEEITHGTQIQIAAKASFEILQEAESFIASNPSSKSVRNMRSTIEESKNLEFNFVKIQNIGKVLLSEMSPASENGKELIQRNLEKVHIGKWSKDQMIIRNQGLVRKLASSHLSRNVPLDDLIQAGNIGLVRAVEKFDPTRGNKFSTYARDWIKQTINRYVDEQHTIKIPEYQRNKISRIRKVQNELLQATGKEAPLSIVAAECEMTENQVETLLTIKQDAVSLNKSFGEGESDLEDFIEDQDSPSPEAAAEEIMIKEELKKALEVLTDDEKEVIIRRFALNGEKEATLEEIGDYLGLSKEAVRLKIQRLLKKLATSTALQEIGKIE
jgi:RNA polymerase primary sigma factor